MESTPSIPVSGKRPHSRYYALVLLAVFLAFPLLYNMASYTPASPYNVPGQPRPGMVSPETEVVIKTKQLKNVVGGIFEMMGSVSNSDLINRWESDGFKCGSVFDNTNLVTSNMYVTHVNNSTGQVYLSIETCNQFGVRKTIGGDVIVIWAEENVASKERPNRKLIVGSVVDNLNGTYSGKLVIRFTGNYTVYANVLSLQRTQCLRFKAMTKYGNSVFSLPNSYGIFFTFENAGVSDTTRCAPIPFIYGYSELCNFTSLNLNYSYYCGKPSNGLTCSDFVTNNMRQYDFQEIGMKRFRDNIIFNPGWGQLKHKLIISITIPHLPAWLFDTIQANLHTQTRNTTSCFSKPKRNSWSSLPSHVYINNGDWNHVSCRTKPLTPTRVRTCLVNKKVFFIGDSTIRQYVEAIGEQIGEKVNYDQFYVTLNSIKDNINITWHKHELPFHNIALRNPRQTNSTENQIRNIANDETIKGSDLILGLTYNTHLQAFPPYVFRDRIKRLVKVLKYLFAKKQEAVVLFKGPAVTCDQVKWFDARISLLYIDILREEFKGLKDKVRYLDIFSISVLNNNQALHPTGAALNHQVQQLIAYACP